MAWIILLLAGISEVAWAIGLKYTEGFTKPIPSIITISFLILSFVLLGVSLRTLPLSVAYGIWVGIGAVGTAILSIYLFNESMSAFKMISLSLIVLGIVGMKISG